MYPSRVPRDFDDVIDMRQSAVYTIHEALFIDVRVMSKFTFTHARARARARLPPHTRTRTHTHTHTYICIYVCKTYKTYMK